MATGCGWPIQFNFGHVLGDVSLLLGGLGEGVVRPCGHPVEEYLHRDAEAEHMHEPVVEVTLVLCGRPANFDYDPTHYAAVATARLRRRGRMRDRLWAHGA
jgi:hypothetical protein